MGVGMISQLGMSKPQSLWNELDELKNNKKRTIYAKIVMSLQLANSGYSNAPN